MDSFPSHSGRLPDGSSWYRDPASITRTSSSAVVESLSFGGSGSQSLASILNNPQVDTSWSVWWPSAATTYAFPDPPPVIIPATPLPIISSSDFQTYISLISDSYSKFEDVRNHASKENADSEIRGQGGALVACLREVPSLFFKEDFALEEGEMFQAACPFSPLASENVALQEKLSQYLDVVEMHLVKEISLRSNSFFEAQGQLQGLDREIVETCARIRELKEMIRILNMDLVDSAKEVQSQNATRCNLVGLHQKLTVILYVSQALSALKLVGVLNSLHFIIYMRHLGIGFCFAKLFIIG